MYKRQVDGPADAFAAQAGVLHAAVGHVVHAPAGDIADHHAAHFQFVPGFLGLGPGVYPFSQSIPYASLADIVGDLELNVPDIVMPPQSVLVTGTYRVYGDLDLDGNVEYEIQNLSAALSLQQAGNIGGEPVTIAITSALTANLSGEVAAPVALPALGPAATLMLSGVLAWAGLRAARRAG